MKGGRPASVRGLRDQPFALSGFGGALTAGSATVREFDRDERWRRALTALGKWWGAAVLCVFIPVAHLILVPGFLIYGAWESWARVQTAELVMDARGQCPDCGEVQQLELAPRWQAPQAVTCPACHRGLTLTLPPGAAS